MLRLAAAAVLSLAATIAAAQDAPEKIRIGYVASLSGPLAPGTLTTTVPNYRLWVKDVNDRGGLMLSKYGKRIPVELIELDDRSNIEDAVRLTERLMTSEKVDLVLAPWGTGTNLAVAPVYHKHGYPLLAVTAVNEKIPELTKRWKDVFFYLGMPSEASKALVDMLSALRQQGKIGDKVALLAVAQQFGAELIGPAKEALAAGGFDIVYEASYPVDVKDLTPQIKAAQAAAPDTFIAFSYPRDTLMLVETAQVNGFRPKVFYTAVGTAFPVFKQKFGDKAEGIFGIGGWDPTVPGAQDYFKRHVAVTGQEPDRWASPLTYASLQMLEQAIEKVGEIDREKISASLGSDTFQTIAGPIRLENNRLVKQWWVGQWQGGEFKGVAPADMPNAVPPVVD
ncbi:twin-arginine translocation pathway signal protein [Rhizobiales bacterium L72]|uniref:Twin-arginine translocation pathway signal protein n=2 Tax=Propylenella binzhouense TaxID=2555902 RepID=A0A964T5E4_9HYPH|nr:twin-arginine translocation pathway signal protein [Propylenella binzhouense]